MVRSVEPVSTITISSQTGRYESRQRFNNFSSFLTIMQRLIEIITYSYLPNGIYSKSFITVSMTFLWEDCQREVSQWRKVWYTVFSLE